MIVDKDVYLAGSDGPNVSDFLEHHGIKEPTKSVSKPKKSHKLAVIASGADLVDQIIARQAANKA